MEQFSVKLSGLNQRIEEEQKIIKGLSDVEGDLWSVRNSLGFQVSSKSGIQNALKSLAQQAEAYESDLKTMRFVLKNVYDQYEKTERRICGYVNDHPITLSDIWNAVNTVGEGMAINAMFPGAGFAWMIYEILKDEEWETKNKFGKYENKIWEGLDKKKKDNKAKKHYEWEDGKGFVEKEDNDKDSDKKKEKTAGEKKKELLESITIWSGSIGKEGSLLHFGKDGDVETDWGKYQYSADIMQAEAKGSVYASLGGIGCEVGVALTALTAKTSGQLGNDMFNVHGEAQVDVGKAELSGGVKVGFVNDEGKFDPSVKAEFSAEAIAAEVSGKVGGTVLGTEINASGSLNFGVGAHADIGFDDGKLSLDVGASLGVGGSVKLEVDVSGTVDAVVEHAGEVVSAVSDFASDAVETVGDFASDAMDTVGNIASGAASKLSKGWNTFKSWW